MAHLYARSVPMSLKGAICCKAANSIKHLIPKLQPAYSTVYHFNQTNNYVLGRSGRLSGEWRWYTWSARDTSNTSAQSQEMASSDKIERGRHKQSLRRKPTLRSTALEATAFQAGTKPPTKPVAPPEEKLVVAYCLAAKYNLPDVNYLLRRRRFVIDPCRTELSKQVIHIEMPISPDIDALDPSQYGGVETGDVFIFPSGNVVAWNVPETHVLRLVQETIWDAGEGHHQLEDEDFEYVEDPGRDKSMIQNEVILLGTNLFKQDNAQHRHVNTVLAKIAFSSGLARSTKLAVLESRLEIYLEGTKSIPGKLMDGNLGSYSRSFIYQKMGQLLDLRRQLNLSSDITDSLPDVFWDTEVGLGLENYYGRMSAALDTEQRIKSLNQKMDYAHEIASILREELSVIREQQSEKHSTRLEWIIILLITVEVMFGSFDLYQKLQVKDAIEQATTDGS